MNFLACDLGGTKVLLGIYENLKDSKIPKLILKEKYFSNEWDSIYSILDDFFRKQSLDISILKSACFAIAGPIKGDNCKLTNLPWNISSDGLKNKLKLNSVELINDFAVLIYGIPFLDRNQFQTIQLGEDSVVNKKLHTIVGAGTGLGISRGLISPEIIEILSSEGGHAEFAPKNSKEWELKLWLKKSLKLERISYERIISGEGLCNIAKWRFSYSDVINHSFQNILNESKISEETKKELASEICNFSAKGDPIFREIENIWLRNYASYLGDVALHELCYGGLWIAGGTAPKHFKNFKSDSFLKHFSDKGRYKDILRCIPVRVILDEEFGLFSAACRAKMLLKTS